MLLTILSNLGMFGGDVPPTPPIETSEGGDGRKRDEQEMQRRNKLLRDDEEVFAVINSFLLVQK